jgi:predicted transcriptional regulator
VWLFEGPAAQAIEDYVASEEWQIAEIEAG